MKVLYFHFGLGHAMSIGGEPTEVRDPYQMKRKKKLTKKVILYCLEIEQNLVLLEQMLQVRKQCQMELEIRMCLCSEVLGSRPCCLTELSG